MNALATVIISVFAVVVIAEIVGEFAEGLLSAFSFRDDTEIARTLEKIADRFYQ